MNFNVLDYWNAIKEKTGDSRSWHDLGLQNQQLVIDSINRLIYVLGTDPKDQDAQP
jgi:hypothetical protein